MQNGKQSTCRFIDTFPLSHRLIMRTGWYGFIAIGLVGISLHNLAWAGIYFAVVCAGFALAVSRAICSHCPYPSQYDSCLFLPPTLVKKLYPYRGPEVSLSGKICTVLALVAIIAFPQYWLKENTFLLFLFWTFCLPSIAAFPLFYCKRCRHTGCPLNTTEQSGCR